MITPNLSQSKNKSSHSGFLLINKPPGPTSHDIIDELRRITGIRQIGHAGTLDPFASGLLFVGIGEATKLLGYYVGLDKKYSAVLRLGAQSDTYDRTGKITVNKKWKTENKNINKKKIEEALKLFIGKQKQAPPMYSAKKIGGRKLYEIARAGQEIARQAEDIEIYAIHMASFSYPLLSIDLRVSSGTYIRSIGHDIGQKLGCGAYLEELTRTAIDGFSVQDAMSIKLVNLTPQPPLLIRRGEGLRPADAGRGTACLPVGRGEVVTKNNWQKFLQPIQTVLVAGTFDGVHPGHINYFQQARQYGQRLIAVVARDKTVLKTKGHYPKYSEKERVQFVKTCPEIDRVYLGSAGSPFDFIVSLKPDIIALGYDQQSFTDNLGPELGRRGLDVKIVRLAAYQPEKYKSSIINQ